MLNVIFNNKKALRIVSPKDFVCRLEPWGSATDGRINTNL